MQKPVAGQWVTFTRVNGEQLQGVVVGINDKTQVARICTGEGTHTCYWGVSYNHLHAIPAPVVMPIKKPEPPPVVSSAWKNFLRFLRNPPGFTKGH